MHTRYPRGNVASSLQLLPYAPRKAAPSPIAPREAFREGLGGLHPNLRYKNIVPRAEPKEGSAVLRGSVATLTAVLDALGPRQIKALEPDQSPTRPTSITDVQDRLKADYLERQYFVTGDVDTGLYTEDCLFADPTISFRGRDKYIRNLQLLKGFFNEPYIDLKGLARENPEEAKLKAMWRLTMQLKLPWKPLIDIDGSTSYTLDEVTFQIQEHREKWSVSAWGAILQIFGIREARE